MRIQVSTLIGLGIGIAAISVALSRPEHGWVAYFGAAWTGALKIVDDRRFVDLFNQTAGLIAKLKPAFKQEIPMPFLAALESLAASAAAAGVDAAKPFAEQAATAAAEASSAYLKANLGAVIAELPPQYQGMAGEIVNTLESVPVDRVLSVFKSVAAVLNLPA